MLALICVLVYIHTKSSYPCMYKKPNHFVGLSWTIRYLGGIIEYLYAYNIYLPGIGILSTYVHLLVWIRLNMGYICVCTICKRILEM